MPGLQNFDYDIYATSKLFEGVIATNDPLRAICCINTSGSPMTYGRFVKFEFENRTMSPLDGSGEISGFLAYKHSHEVVRDANGNAQVEADESGDVYKTGSFTATAVTPIANGDPVYVVDNPASPDNGRVGNASTPGGVLLANARFESTRTTPGNVTIYIENVG